MSFLQQLITIVSMGLATFLMRALPFLLFKDRTKTPQVMIDLGRMLPLAVFALLIVYCLRDVSVFSGSRGVPEALGILATVLLHKWKKNTLLSIAGGSLFYMVLVQLIF